MKVRVLLEGFGFVIQVSLCQLLRTGRHNMFFSSIMMVMVMAMVVMVMVMVMVVEMVIVMVMVVMVVRLRMRIRRVVIWL